MKYFVKIVFIWVLCLSFKSPIIYAQTESLIEPHSLTEEGLSLDHDSGETGGILIVTARNPYMEQGLLHINVQAINRETREYGHNALSPIKIDILMKNENGRGTGGQFLFELEENQLYHVFINDTFELIGNGDTTVHVLWTPYRLVQ